MIYGNMVIKKGVSSWTHYFQNTALIFAWAYCNSFFSMVPKLVKKTNSSTLLIFSKNYIFLIYQFLLLTTTSFKNMKHNGLCVLYMLLKHSRSEYTPVKRKLLFRISFSSIFRTKYIRCTLPFGSSALVYFTLSVCWSRCTCMYLILFVGIYQERNYKPISKQQKKYIYNVFLYIF